MSVPRTFVPRLLVAAALLPACGDNLSVPDAREIDAPPPADAAIDGPCGAGLYVTGEIVDIDSTTATFAGGAAATLTLRGVAGVMDATSPNGRFELCAPAQTTYVFDVDITKANPVATDGVDGIAYIEPEALTAGNEIIDFRSFTPARLASFLDGFGITVDPAKAHIFVDLTGDVSALTLDRAHATPLGGNDPDDDGAFTWAAGLGRYVLFPNVDATQGDATLGGDATGGNHTVPVEAGKITYVALSWRFL